MNATDKQISYCATLLGCQARESDVAKAAEAKFGKLKGWNKLGRCTGIGRFFSKQHASFVICKLADK